MVGITPPRKLQPAGLFSYTSPPSIDGVMSATNENPMPYPGSSGDRGDPKLPRGGTYRATLDMRFGKTMRAATRLSKKGARTWKAMLSPDARC